MSKLTYCLVFNPNMVVDKDFNNVNFLCIDKKIHIRLRDFNHPEVIHGFINKLTYLMTYLVNTWPYSGSFDAKEFLTSFESGDAEFEKVNKFIEYILKDTDFKGIKLFPAYRRKHVDPQHPFGTLAEGTYPVYSNFGLGDVNFFLDTLGINLFKFLFDDRYEIVIKEVSDIDTCYSKFTNKEIKSSTTSHFEYVDLW